MRKTIVIILTILFLIPTLALAEGGGELIMPEGKEHKAAFLEDENTKTFVNFSYGEQVTLTWTQAGSKALIEWQSIPESFTVDYLDAGGSVLLSETRSDGVYMQLLEHEGCFGVTLTFVDRRTQLSTLRTVGSDFELPFELNSGGCDLVIVLAELGQESLIMGPIFTQYCLENKMDVQVVYLRDATRERIEETFSTLRALGVRRYPRLLEREDSGYTSYQSIVNGWNGKESEKLLFEAIGSYNPRIIVTLNPLESNEHGPSRLTAEMVLQAINNGCAPSLQKLYILSDEGKTRISAPSEQQQTLLEAYRLQDSQRVFRFTPNAEVRLELSYSAVGEDKDCNSLVENIDTLTLRSFLTPSPAPTAPPSPAPTDALAAEPTGSPTNEPSEPEKEPQPADKDGVIGWYVWVLPLAAAMLIAAVYVSLRRKKK